MRTIFGLLVAATMLTTSACTVATTHLSIASTKPFKVPFDDPGLSTEGEACTHFIASMIFAGDPVGKRTEVAAARAFEGKSGNALVDGEVTEFFWNAILYGQACNQVRGKLVNISFGR